MSRNIDPHEIVVSTERDEDDPQHSWINVRPGTTLLWVAVDEQLDEQEADRLAPLAWHQANLLHRAAEKLREELDLDRVLHGCTWPTWYIISRGTDQSRRAKKGDSVGPGEYASRGISSGCGDIYLADDGDFGTDAQITVPTKRLKHYTERVREVLREVADAVPEVRP